MDGSKRESPRAFSTARAAALLDMSPEVLRYRIKHGDVRAVRIGARLFVPSDEIERLVTPRDMAVPA